MIAKISFQSGDWWLVWVVTRVGRSRGPGSRQEIFEARWALSNLVWAESTSPQICLEWSRPYEQWCTVVSNDPWPTRSIPRDPVHRSPSPKKYIKNDLVIYQIYLFLPNLFIFTRGVWIIFAAQLRKFPPNLLPSSGRRRRRFGFPSKRFASQGTPPTSAVALAPHQTRISYALLLASINGGLVPKRRRENLRYFWSYPLSLSLSAFFFVRQFWWSCSPRRNLWSTVVPHGLH
jgi:hypothetical protein